jgi:hypothetical protein
MAYITLVSGGAQPVFATDVLNGSVSQSANLANASVTNFQGPKLDFYQIVANSALTVAGAGNAWGFVSNTLTSIQQTCTVAMYQVSPTASANALNLAIYPTGAFANTTVFLTAAQGANASGGLNIGWSSATAAATFTTQ